MNTETHSNSDSNSNTNPNSRSDYYSKYQTEESDEMEFQVNEVQEINDDIEQLQINDQEEIKEQQQEQVTVQEQTNQQQVTEQEEELKEEVKESIQLPETDVKESKKTIRRTPDEKLLILLNRKVQQLKEQLIKLDNNRTKTINTKKYYKMDRSQKSGILENFKFEESELQNKIKIWESAIIEMEKDMKQSINTEKKVKRIPIPRDAVGQWKFIFNNFKETDDQETQSNLCKIAYRNSQEILKLMRVEYERIQQEIKKPDVDKTPLKQQCQRLWAILTGIVHAQNHVEIPINKIKELNTFLSPRHTTPMRRIHKDIMQ